MLALHSVPHAIVEIVSLSDGGCHDENGGKRDTHEKTLQEREAN
jgi:hypothetical protein